MEDFSIKKATIMALIIMIIIVAFYFITILVLDRKKAKEQENIYTAIQYDEIIVGNIYNQKEDEYYVLATMKSDSNAPSYVTNLENYAKTENALKTYTINLDSGFNKKYVAEESDFTSKYPIFSTSTLVKVSNKEIKETYEGKEITEFLNSITNNEE